MEEGKHEYHFFVDAKKYETSKTALTGAEIKQIAGVLPQYQLYLEEEGDVDDKPISDTQNVEMREPIKHFYAVPPATFGTR